MTVPAVAFDFAAWSARYPEFAAIGSTVATGYFAEAGLYCANDTCNPAFPLGILSTLLNMLTAHIAAMNSGVNGQPPSNLVGRVTSGAIGPVSVQTEYDSSGSPSEAWYVQTKYGAAYWAATAQFRTAIPVLCPTIVPTGVFPIRRWY